MGGLRLFLRELNETRCQKEKLFAHEQARLAACHAGNGHGVIVRRPSATLFAVIDTRQELEVVARACTRPL